MANNSHRVPHFPIHKLVKLRELVHRPAGNTTWYPIVFFRLTEHLASTNMLIVSTSTYTAMAFIISQSWPSVDIPTRRMIPSGLIISCRHAKY